MSDFWARRKASVQAEEREIEAQAEVEVQADRQGHEAECRGERSEHDGTETREPALHERLTSVDVVPLPQDVDIVDQDDRVVHDDAR